jgi:hypothetical protein
LIGCSLRHGREFTNEGAIADAVVVTKLGRLARCRNLHNILGELKDHG